VASTDLELLLILGLTFLTLLALTLTGILYYRATRQEVCKESE